MLTPTLEAGLAHYQIGRRVRALRLRKKMGLVELGRHTGLSAAMLSKVECGRLYPTLPTLLRISLVFGVGLDHFFNDPVQRPVIAVVRKRERQRFPNRPDAKRPAYYFECLDFPATNRPTSAYYVEFESADDAELARHEHPGVETVYVIRGTLGLTIGETEETLGPGDSIYFDATHPHGYRKKGNGPCAGIVVTAP